MLERMGFILKTPGAVFDYESVASTGNVDRALFADIGVYETWWDIDLDIENAAMLLGGLRPHIMESTDDKSWVYGFRRMVGRIEKSISTKVLHQPLSLAALVSWAPSVEQRLKPCLLDLAARNPLPVCAPTETRPQIRNATKRIKEKIDEVVERAADCALRRGMTFDRKRMPGSKDELANVVNATLQVSDRRQRATLHDYFKDLGLRWPTHTVKGDLTKLLG